MMKDGHGIRSVVFSVVLLRTLGAAAATAAALLRMLLCSQCVQLSAKTKVLEARHASDLRMHRPLVYASLDHKRPENNGTIEPHQNEINAGRMQTRLHEAVAKVDSHVQELRKQGIYSGRHCADGPDAPSAWK